MTTDSIKELVKRLDENWGRRRIGDMSCLLADAADALEALAGEVERWEKNHEALQDKFDSMRTCACQYDSSDAVCMAHSPALKAAEAERDRLKAALVEIKTKAPKSSPEMDDDYGGNFDDAWSGGWDSGFNAAANIARKALGGDA